MGVCALIERLGEGLQEKYSHEQCGIKEEGYRFPLSAHRFCCVILGEWFSVEGGLVQAI